MEIYELWAVLIKSLVRSQKTLISANVSSLSFIFIYLIAITVAPTRQLRLSFLCFIASLFVGRSLIYDYLDGYTLHLGYSIIYLFCVKYIKELKAIIALCIVAWFNLLMSWDAYHYATIETWLFNNYIGITTCCHCIIIFVCIDWRRIINSVNNMLSGLRALWLNNCHFLYL